MPTEILWLLEAWLKDGTNGVNALLASVPKRGSDPTPRSVTIYSEASDEDVALDKDPAKVPALVLVMDSEAEEDLTRKQPNSGSVEIKEAWVALAFVDRDVAVLTSMIEGNYALRGAKKSLRLYNLCRDPNFREMNSIKLIDIMSIRSHNVSGQIGSSRVAGFLRAKVRYQDSSP